MTLPLTVLLHEGPMARAYLSVLRSAGLMPRKIIRMVLKTSPAGKPVAGWLPRALRLAAAGKVQNLRHNHAVRDVTLRHRALVDSILQVSAVLDAPPNYLNDLLRGTDVGAPTLSILVSGIGDPALVEAIGPGAGIVLFTGGGIVPRSLLDLPGTTFLHIHPGLLPHVRGADGLLWSLLLRGQPGCTCFVMASGIDTGRILHAKEFKPLRIPLAERPPDSVLYAATYAIMDPLLRALCLREVICTTGGLQNLSLQAQDLTQGTTFHFMHSYLRRKAFSLLYPDRP